jgi:predicted nucleic acid-binding protein
MKFFLDANILVSVLNKEYPSYPYTARILSLADNSRYKLVTSSICLAIAYYFAEKKHGDKLAKSKIAILAEHIDIADTGKNEVLQALKDKKVHDLEDGFEYYTAHTAKCDCIITFDTRDFYFSEIEVLEPEHFLKKYFSKIYH